LQNRQQQNNFTASNKFIKNKIQIMKLLKAFVIILTAHTLLSSTCSKNDDVIAPGSGGNIAGNWKVSLYYDNSKDETYKLSGYSFIFNSSGVISAINGGTTVNGTWTETSSKLVIDFGTHPVLSDLNDDWLKEEKTAASIKLKDDNPARIEKLQFVKN
jgi:hypothetical protein